MHTNTFRFGALCAALLATGAVAATHLSTVHPSYTLTNLRPGAFKPTVGGMAFLSDGRLVVGSWLGTRSVCCTSSNIGGRQYTGKVYVLSGVTADNPVVSIDTIASGLEDIMGLTVVRDTIYVSGGNVIVRLNRNGNSGPVTRIDTVFILPGTPVSGNDSLKPVKGRSEWFYGLIARNDTFFVNPSSMVNGNLAQLNPHRGVHLAVKAGDGIANKRGSFQVRATGFRHHAGLAFGPEGSVWTVETQGNWVPTNKLIHIKTGAHYGYRHTGISADSAWNSLPETPAAVFMPQEGPGGNGSMNSSGIISNSPGQPLYLTQGPYAGQFIMGDVSWGGIQRFFVEKVNGEWQGAVFAWMGGLEGGVYRLAEGTDGQIYAGMMGATGDWSWNAGVNGPRSGDFSGLQKLKYNGTATFEMLAVRSRAQGMEIEFTMPVDTVQARQASSYIVRTYYYTPTAAYGGNKASGSLVTLAPTAIQISPDRRSVYLALPGLVARTGNQHRIVEINLRKSYRSAAGAAPRDTIAFYTLNAISPTGPFGTVVSVDPALAAKRLARELAWRVTGEELMVRAPFRGPYTLRLLDAGGRTLAAAAGSGTEFRSFPRALLRGPVVLEAAGDGARVRRMILP